MKIKIFEIYLKLLRKCELVNDLILNLKYNLNS